MDLLFLALIIVIAVVSLVFLSKRFISQTKAYSYQKKATLFSPAERSFLGVLQQAVGENARVFGKVRVADVLSPGRGMSRSGWQTSFNKISGKHFDFLLCEPGNLSILCAIELNDRSHDAAQRKDRDVFLENACRSAGLPLIWVSAKAAYSIPEIQEVLLNALQARPS